MSSIFELIVSLDFADFGKVFVKILPNFFHALKAPFLTLTVCCEQFMKGKLIGLVCDACLDRLAPVWRHAKLFSI